MMTDLDEIKKARLAKNVKRMTNNLNAAIDFKVRDKKWEIFE